MVDDFSTQVARSPFATFGGGVGIILLLVVAAYAESFLRTIRRGYRRKLRAPVAGLAVVGVFFGVTATFWGWMLGLAHPTLIGFVIPAVFGAASGVLAGLAALQIGKRARVRRQSNRLVLVARRSSLPTGALSAGGRG